MAGDQGGKDPDLDKAGQADVEGRAEPSAATGQDSTPPAGPHADPALVNPEATPGAGSLPSPSPDDEADAATG